MKNTEIHKITDVETRNARLAKKALRKVALVTVGVVVVTGAVIAVAQKMENEESEEN